MVELFANSGDPDQMPCSAVSDLGLHCLQVNCLGVSSPQWAKEPFKIKADDKSSLFSFFKENKADFSCSVLSFFLCKKKEKNKKNATAAVVIDAF